MRPLDLPSAPSGIAQVTFEPARVDYAAPEASGRQGGVQAGWPLWSASFELDQSDPDSADMWRAFFARLRGRMRRFFAGDPTRPFPRAYPGGFAGVTKAGGGAFTGAAAGWAQNIDGDGNAIVALTGLPANMTLSLGDYIGWKWDAEGGAAGNFERRTMARVVVAANASAAGAVSVMVEPPLNTLLVPAGAIAHLDRPMCVMQISPEDSELGPIGRAGILAGGSIAAIQDLRP